MSTATILAIAAGTIVSGVALLPLVWDGSEFMFESLNQQSPYIPYHRVGVALLDGAVVAASWVTEDFGVLRAIFSLSHAVVPLVAIVAAWLVVRHSRPDLLVWPAVGIGAVLAQGHAIAVAGSLVASELSWPLLLAAIVPASGIALILSATLGVIVALAHPVGAVLLGIIGVIGVSMRRGRERITWALLSGALVGLNLIALSLRLEPYEVTSAQPLAIAYQLSGEIGPQLVGVVLAGVACLALIRGGRAEQRSARNALHGRAIVALAAAAVPLLVWAADAEQWRTVVGFRVWAMPLTAALFVGAALDARWSAPHIDADLLRARARLGLLAATIFVAVATIQGITWAMLVRRVESAVDAQHGCVPALSIDGFADSPLDNWSIVPLSVILQGRTVRAFVATPDACATPWPGPIPLPFDAPLTPRWFRFE